MDSPFSTIANWRRILTVYTMNTCRQCLIFLLASLSLLLISCQVTTPSPSVLYMSWDASDHLQLFILDVEGQTSQQLTDLAEGVVQYALSPDKLQIAYVVAIGETGSEIWVMGLNGRFQPTTYKLLLSCPNSACSQLTWSPDNRRLIYEKRAIDAQTGALGTPSLWWLDTQTGNSVEVLPEVDRPTSGATLSPNGAWLSYSVPSDELVYVYNFENGRYFNIPSISNNGVAWHPNSETFIIQDHDLVVLHQGEGDDHLTHGHDFEEAIHLFEVSTRDEQRQILTEAGQVDDGTAVYSPDGEWVVFGRRAIRTNTGRQLWLMRADGSEKRPLTDNLTIQHGAVSWSENGRFLLYQTTSTQNPNSIPTLWLMDLETEEQVALIENGIQGSWLTEYE